VSYVRACPRYIGDKCLVSLLAVQIGAQACSETSAPLLARDAEMSQLKHRRNVCFKSITTIMVGWSCTISCAQHVR